MIKRIHYHSLDTSMLLKNGWVLDIGCNDFLFSRYMLDQGLNVVGLDPLEGIVVPKDLLDTGRFTYLKAACVGIKDSDTKTYYSYAASGANSLYNTPENLHDPIHGGHANNPFKGKYNVKIITISEIMSLFKIDQFEVIKMDCEGAEYSILENMPPRCAKQITIEFHDFLHLTPIRDIELYHKNLRSKLKEYEVVVEEEQRGDSLYILKKDFKQND